MCFDLSQTHKDEKADEDALTVETKNPINQKTIGQRTGLSFLDAKHLNLAYCASNCAISSTSCQNGGYPNPNNCETCLCPEGFAGDFCEGLSPAQNGGRHLRFRTEL
jgi:astacin